MLSTWWLNASSFPDESTTSSVYVKHMAQDKLSEISSQNNTLDPAAEGLVLLPQWNGDLDKEASHTNLSWPRKRKPRCNPLILPSRRGCMLLFGCTTWAPTNKDGKDSKLKWAQWRGQRGPARRKLWSPPAEEPTGWRRALPEPDDSLQAEGKKWGPGLRSCDRFHGDVLHDGEGEEYDKR